MFSGIVLKSIFISYADIGYTVISGRFVAPSCTPCSFCTFSLVCNPFNIPPAVLSSLLLTLSFSSCSSESSTFIPFISGSTGKSIPSWPVTFLGIGYLLFANDVYVNSAAHPNLFLYVVSCFKSSAFTNCSSVYVSRFSLIYSLLIWLYLYIYVFVIVSLFSFEPPIPIDTFSLSSHFKYACT